MPHSFTDLTGLEVRAEDFLAAVLGAAGQPIWVVDRDDVIRFANPAALAALGYEVANDLLGRRSHPTIHYRRPDGAPYPAEDCPMRLPRATGETVARDLDWFFRRDGSMFPVSYVAVPLDMPEGRGAVIAFSDIEDRLRWERELRERDELLAAQQASLRRVATLVAGGAASTDVFGAVASEVARVLGVATVQICRHEPDGTEAVVGAWGEPPRELGIRSSASAPIVIEGEPWGTIRAATVEPGPAPDDLDERLVELTQLVGTAIANVEARSDLAASRARIVAAADEERRRVVRDLHDGAQQRLVHTVVTLKLARQALEQDDESGTVLVARALDQAQHAIADLRELAHGILPSVLITGGLRAGVNALASRVPVPVETQVSAERLPSAVEATAYFVVAEALTNVAKHSHAERATVRAHVQDGTLQIQVRDDGVGGAQAGGSGLVGMADRLAVVDGRLRIESPADGGTLVRADIPLPA